MICRTSKRFFLQMFVLCISHCLISVIISLRQSGTREEQKYKAISGDPLAFPNRSGLKKSTQTKIKKFRENGAWNRNKLHGYCAIAFEGRRPKEALEKLPQLYLQRSPVNQRQRSTINWFVTFYCLTELGYFFKAEQHSELQRKKFWFMGKRVSPNITHDAEFIYIWECTARDLHQFPPKFGSFIREIRVSS